MYHKNTKLLYNNNITIYGGLIIFMFSLINLPLNISYSQPNSQPHSQSQSENSIISDLCAIVEQNALVATITGNSEPVAICKGWDLLNSNQTLSRLCSAIDSINVINTSGLCVQSQSNQTLINNTTSDNLHNIGKSGNELLNNVIELIRSFI